MRIASTQVLVVFILLFSTSLLKAKEEPKTVRELLNQSMHWYDMVVERGAKKETLKPKEVLLWTNPARGGHLANGLSAVCDYEDRPVAMLGIFVTGGDLVTHEFHLLARRPGVRALDNGAQLWRPRPTQVMKFTDVPDATAPRKSERIRLVQMKQLAKRFEVELLGFGVSNSEREMLRRLATPVHRYGKADSDTLDGAIFAFCVDGTDPEAWLQIEAYRDADDKPYKWQYAFSQSTSAAMVARFDRKQVVWELKRNTPLRDPTRAWFSSFKRYDHKELPNK